MAIATYFNNEVFIQTLYVNTISIPSGSITDASVAAGAAIDADKLTNRVHATYQQADGSNVASTSGDGVAVYACDKTNGATIKKVTALCMDTGSGGAPVHNIAIDVFKWDDSAGTAATILSTDIDITESQNDYDLVNGTLSDTDMDTGDVLTVRVTVTGSGGTAPQGLLVQVEIDEEPT